MKCGRLESQKVKSKKKNWTIETKNVKTGECWLSILLNIHLICYKVDPDSFSQNICIGCRGFFSAQFLDFAEGPLDWQWWVPPQPPWRTEQLPIHRKHEHNRLQLFTVMISQIKHGLKNFNTAFSLGDIFFASDDAILTKQILFGQLLKYLPLLTES